MPPTSLWSHGQTPKGFAKKGALELPLFFAEGVPCKTSEHKRPRVFPFRGPQKRIREQLAKVIRGQGDFSTAMSSLVSSNCVSQDSPPGFNKQRCLSVAKSDGTHFCGGGGSALCSARVPLVATVGCLLLGKPLKRGGFEQTPKGNQQFWGSAACLPLISTRVWRFPAFDR